MAGGDKTTLRRRESTKLKGFSASLGNSKIKRLFSIIRKQHYDYLTFARRQIKNSTFGGNAKIKVFSDGLNGNISITPGKVPN